MANDANKLPKPEEIAKLIEDLSLRKDDVSVQSKFNEIGNEYIKQFIEAVVRQDSAYSYVRVVYCPIAEKVAEELQKMLDTRRAVFILNAMASTYRYPEIAMEDDARDMELKAADFYYNAATRELAPEPAYLLYAAEIYAKYNSNMINVCIDSANKRGHKDIEAGLHERFASITEDAEEKISHLHDAQKLYESCDEPQKAASVCIELAKLAAEPEDKLGFLNDAERNANKISGVFTYSRKEKILDAIAPLRAEANKELEKKEALEYGVSEQTQIIETELPTVEITKEPLPLEEVIEPEKQLEQILEPEGISPAEETREIKVPPKQPTQEIRAEELSEIPKEEFPVAEETREIELFVTEEITEKPPSKGEIMPYLDNGKTVSAKELLDPELMQKEMEDAKKDEEKKKAAREKPLSATDSERVKQEETKTISVEKPKEQLGKTIISPAEIPELPEQRLRKKILNAEISEACDIIRKMETVDGNKILRAIYDRCGVYVAETDPIFKSLAYWFNKARKKYGPDLLYLALEMNLSATGEAGVRQFKEPDNLVSPDGSINKKYLSFLASFGTRDLASLIELRRNKMLEQIKRDDTRYGAIRDNPLAIQYELQRDVCSHFRIILDASRKKHFTKSPEEVIEFLSLTYRTFTSVEKALRDIDPKYEKKMESREGIFDALKAFVMPFLIFLALAVTVGGLYVYKKMHTGDRPIKEKPAIEEKAVVPKETKESPFKVEVKKVKKPAPQKTEESAKPAEEVQKPEEQQKEEKPVQVSTTETPEKKEQKEKTEQAIKKMTGKKGCANVGGYNLCPKKKKLTY